jgi:DMSO reductase anchor subunit
MRACAWATVVMHPALSVIFFTTLSGAGLGLLFWLGLVYASAPLPLSREYALIPLGVGGVLLAIGLLSSMLHLGRPLRAWRALGQWRTSWLSREGVVSLATYAPLIVLGVFIWQGRFGLATTIVALALALFAALSVLCTSRIYDTLKTIAAWHNGLVLPNYLAMAALNGAWWFAALLSMTGWQPSRGIAVGLVLLAISAALLKLAYWRRVDHQPIVSTTGSMTGLGHLGTVRPFEAPHTETNYRLREMGFVVARKHARVLRRIAFIVGFVLPALIASVLVFFRTPTMVAPWLALVLVHVGLFVERWLFFAQARHVVTAYYRPT